MLIPPGLPTCASAAVTVQGCVEGYETWREFHVIKRYTNAFVWDPETKKVLLGYKKRGFGKGMYNGFGGKVDPGETVLQAGRRELIEEAGIDAPLEPCGVLFFVGEGGAFAHHITVFKATSYTGTITETDEMRPEWFAFPSTTTEATPDPGLNPDIATTDAAFTSDPDPSFLGSSKSDLSDPGIQSSNPAVGSVRPNASTDASDLRVDSLNVSNLDSSSTNDPTRMHPSPNDLPPFPYPHMWKDDPLWVPLLLSHKPFIGRVDYGPIDGGQEKESDMQKWWIAAVDPDEFSEGRVWEV